MPTTPPKLYPIIETAPLSAVPDPEGAASNVTFGTLRDRQNGVYLLFTAGCTHANARAAYMPPTLGLQSGHDVKQADER